MGTEKPVCYELSLAYHLVFCLFFLVLGKGITILPDFRILSCLKVYLQDMGPFCGATDTPHLDFCWCRPLVSKSGWIPCLHASSPVFNGFIRLTSGATPADLLTASIAAEPFWSTYLDCNLYLHILIARLFWGARFLFPGHTEPPAKCSFTPFNLISENMNPSVSDLAHHAS